MTEGEGEDPVAVVVRFAGGNPLQTVPPSRRGESAATPYAIRVRSKGSSVAGSARVGFYSLLQGGPEWRPYRFSASRGRVTFRSLKVTMVLTFGLRALRLAGFLPLP